MTNNYLSKDQHSTNGFPASTPYINLDRRRYGRNACCQRGNGPRSLVCRISLGIMNTMTDESIRPKPLLIILLDGFGISSQTQGNPAAEASTPTFHEIESFFPFTTLQASGIAVGLPWSEPGNSEVGHLTIGAGRVLYHHLPRIISSVADGSFFENEALKKAAAHVRANRSCLHIAGLVSSGSVHSNINHLYALFEFAARERIEKVFLHAFTDGKDALPEEGASFFSSLEDRTKKEFPPVTIATIVGRFFAMDRDNRWDRIEKTYLLLTEEVGNAATSPHEYLTSSYAKGVSDEFVEPGVFPGPEHGPRGTIRDNDAVIFFNFREDSMRELTHAFVDDSFSHFPRKKVKNLFVATMTEYEKNLPGVASAFPRLEVTHPLVEVLGNAGMTHLHIAETEKYAHVTYFFNGGREEPYPGEERILIPSFSTPHFDLVPEMRSPDITEAIIHNFKRFDIIIVNYANADMVGHAGNFEAATKAINVLDGEIKKILGTITQEGGVAIITADHGNIEMKRDTISGAKLTAHSTDPVPLYLIGNEFRREVPRTDAEIKNRKSSPAGIITDIAPTVLELLGISKPEEMTGKSLLQTLLSE